VDGGSYSFGNVLTEKWGIGIELGLFIHGGNHFDRLWFCSIMLFGRWYRLKKSCTLFFNLVGSVLNFILIFMILFYTAYPCFILSSLSCFTSKLELIYSFLFYFKTNNS